jgi:hypothetical protein
MKIEPDIVCGAAIIHIFYRVVFIKALDWCNYHFKTFLSYPNVFVPYPVRLGRKCMQLISTLAYHAKIYRREYLSFFGSCSYLTLGVNLLTRFVS